MNPDNDTLGEHMLDVGDGHTLYVQDWGSVDAQIPIIFIHGGPGSQSKDSHKSVFDPVRHRVIFFDQRGCGKSAPYGSLSHNDTAALIRDITLIANSLEVNRFVLHGTSWGACLALAYAVVHPARVHALVVGGILTGAYQELQWIDAGGFKTFYPDVWDAYLARTPAEHRGDPSAYHFDSVLHGTPEQRKRSAYAYDCMEGGVIQLDDRAKTESFDTYDPAGMIIEMHYMANHCFMPDRHVLDNAPTLTMPAHIVQGRYDMVCPPQAAYELHQALPNSHLYWTLGGHKSEHETEGLFRSIFAAL